MGSAYVIMVRDDQAVCPIDFRLFVTINISAALLLLFVFCLGTGGVG